MSYFVEILKSSFDSSFIMFLLLIVLILVSLAILCLIINNKQPQKNYKNEKNNRELEELQSITQELETIPRERTIELTPYEEEQEKKAIISYDELISKENNAHIAYDNEYQNDDLIAKKVDLVNTGTIELDPIKKELNKKVVLINYEHEEQFLEVLKQLQNLLN